MMERITGVNFEVDVETNKGGLTAMRFRSLRDLVDYVREEWPGLYDLDAPRATE